MSYISSIISFAIRETTPCCTRPPIVFIQLSFTASNKARSMDTSIYLLAVRCGILPRGGYNSGLQCRAKWEKVS